MMEIADDAGFPSETFGIDPDFGRFNCGDGVVPYLIDRFKKKRDRSERKRLVLLANIRYNNAVHAHVGTEKEKVAAAKIFYPRTDTLLVAKFLHKVNDGRGVKGVLSTILSYL